MKSLCKHFAYSVAYGLGFIVALTFMFAVEILFPFAMSSMEKEVPPMVNFSCENLKRNRKYRITLANGKGTVVGYFDTLVRNGGKAMFCVFSEKRNGKGNVVLVATSVEIEAAIEINAKGAEKE